MAAARELRRPGSDLPPPQRAATSFHNLLPSQRHPPSSSATVPQPLAFAAVHDLFAPGEHAAESATMAGCSSEMDADANNFSGSNMEVVAALLPLDVSHAFQQRARGGESPSRSAASTRAVRQGSACSARNLGLKCNFLFVCTWMFLLFPGRIYRPDPLSCMCNVQFDSGTTAVQLFAEKKEKGKKNLLKNQCSPLCEASGSLCKRQNDGVNS
ncbi:uncharacterized protein LOC125534192 isoform X3 [Triticum urartu]|uniref:uncharacterized protein LOC125534170 isoform X3 n=1 Tax=Triticum urartu TaxID=4572 RepID=UPI0020436778|nr:uncharacterized protein LOC125534170 isoform X3 [Triticum urartu]XP_048553443.1 uncharacterized protein LOC125534192 isoform X3 [Triticum urartu]